VDSPEEQKSPVRVLVAEDEALIRMDLVEMLSELGYQVIGEASDGEMAIRLAEELHPDVVMMDVKMPVLDGITAAATITEQRLAPVVMLTAFSQRELVDRATQAGVMAYLVKPFSLSDLAPAIEVAVSRFQQYVTLESEVADLTERLETRKRVDRAKALLQQVYGLTEADAFRWLQKSAMDRRLSMRDVADVVIAETRPATSS
jgi:response regulator NasT